MVQSRQNSQSLQDNHVVEECGGNTNRECLEKSESGQQNQIGRVAVAFPVQKAQVYKGSKERDIERPSTAQFRL